MGDVILDAILDDFEDYMLDCVDYLKLKKKIGLPNGLNVPSGKQTTCSNELFIKQLMFFKRRKHNDLHLVRYRMSTTLLTIQFR